MSIGSHAAALGARTRLVVPAALVALVMIAFWGIWRFDFTNFDDPQYVLQNPHVRGLSVENVRWAFTSFHEVHWLPGLWISYMIDYELWGYDPGGYHLDNLLLHVAAVLLLFRALTALTHQRWRSAIVAALFGVHPVHVESVVWIAERKDVLSALCWMLSLLAYVRYCERPGVLRYLAIMGAMAVGLASKQILVVLPLVLLLLDHWPLERLRSRADLWRSIGEKLPLFALSLASSVITWISTRSVHVPLDRLGVEDRLTNAALAVLRYVRMFFWPVDLAVFYPLSSGAVALPAALAAGVLVVAGTVGCFALARRRPYLIVGWLWFLSCLLPVIGLVQIFDQAVADRYLHLSSIGLSLLVVWSAADVVASARVSRSVVAGATLALVLSLAAATQLQAGYWRDSQTLFERAIDVTGGSSLAHYNLALTLAKEGKHEEAVHHYRSALQFHPDNPLVYNGLGIIHARRGDLESAVAAFEKALSIRPDFEEARYNLVLGYVRMGRLEDAAEQVEEGIRFGAELGELGREVQKRFHELPEYR